MNSAHTAGAYAETGGKIFAIGGSQNPTSLEIYDPVLDQWIAFSACKILFCNFLTVLSMLLDAEFPIQTQIEFLHTIHSQTWSEKNNMPTARHAASLVVLDGKIWGWVVDWSTF